MRLQNIDNKKVECEEPCDGRLSSTVPREEWGETPRSYSTNLKARIMIEVADTSLRQAAREGMDEFVKVFTDAYKNVGVKS